VFLAGLEAGVEGRDSGITSATILEDEPLDVPSGGKRWRPENFDRTFVGPLPARRALEESRNVPTARLALEVGIDRVVEAAKRCGIETELRPLASIALGAQEVSPLELATAYATLAAGGRRPSIRVIREVSPSPPEGVVLPAPVPEVSPAVSYVLTDMLRGVIDRGTASSARALGFSGVAAGKTGTTDDERDAWFVGYTPDLVTLVWVGFDDGARTGLTGSSGALPIWVEIMRAAAFRANVATLPEPEGVVRVEIDPASGEQASSACPERREEVFVSGTEPATPCSLHERRFLRWLRRLFGRER